MGRIPFTLWAVRFDLAKLELIGDAVPVIEHIMTPGEAAPPPGIVVVQNGTEELKARVAGGK